MSLVTAAMNTVGDGESSGEKADIGRQSSRGGLGGGIVRELRRSSCTVGIQISD